MQKVYLLRLVMHVLLVNDSSIFPLCSSLHTADVGCASIAELRDVTDTSSSADSAWTTMGMHARVLVCVIMEPDGFGLRSGEDGTSLA